MYLFLFVCLFCLLLFCFVFFPFRVIKPEEGKKLADSWGAAFMESSAKENEVVRNILLNANSEC